MTLFTRALVARSLASVVSTIECLSADSPTGDSNYSTLNFKFFFSTVACKHVFFSTRWTRPIMTVFLADVIAA
jgi:hypothetical protein